MERQSLVHKGESPYSMVPGLKSTAFMLLTIPSPRTHFPTNSTFIYIQITLTSPLLLSAQVGVFRKVVFKQTSGSQGICLSLPWTPTTKKSVRVVCQTRRIHVQWLIVRGWMQMVLMPCDLFSKHIDKLTTFEHIDKGLLKMPLRARWFLFVPPGSSFLLPPAPCWLLPCWELTAYLPPCLGGLALPHPLPLSWPHFPQVPGNALPLCRAQVATVLPLWTFD